MIEKQDMVAFNLDLDKFFGRIKDVDVPKALIGIALEITKRVIKRTPVDTGRARAGWLPAIDGLGGVSTGDNRGEGSVVKNLANTNTPSIEITNSVPYITGLEYGHSKKAPTGMVRVSLAEISREIK